MHSKVPKMFAKGEKSQDVSQDEQDLMSGHQVLTIGVQSVQNMGSRGGKKSFLLLSLEISIPGAFSTPLEAAPAAPHPILPLCHSPSQERSARLASLVPALCTLQEC